MKDSFQINKKIDLYQEEILIRNYSSFKRFMLGGMIITGFVTLAGYAMMRYTEFVKEYFMFFLYFCVWYIVANLCFKKKGRYILPVFYIALFPVYLGGIVMGTFLDPEKPAIIIMILLCTLTMFITDKPWRMVSYLLIVAGIFSVCAFYSKDAQVFLSDMVDVVIYSVIGIGVNFMALSDRVESAENYVLVRKQAEQDKLTSILNRGTGEKKVEQLLSEEIAGAFLMVDIDNFKTFNDTYGHQVGDEVICAVSSQLEKTFRTTDIVWRLGGDEFAAYAPNLLNREQCEQHLKQISLSLKSVKTSIPEPLCVTVSIGCIICTMPEIGFDQLYKLSDSALYEAKENGKDGFVIYDM